MERVRVVLRIRPNAEGSDDEDIIDVRSNQKVVISKPGKKNTYLLSQQTRYYEYTFDHIFPPISDQETVYNISVCNFIKDSVTNGINLTIFVYGATGTGKTYTIIGNEKNPGIVIRGINEAFEHLSNFDWAKVSQDFASSNQEIKEFIAAKRNQNFFVTASYMEIYNETIRDLLNPSNNVNISSGQYSCEILEDQSNIQISNLTQLLITDGKEGVQALNFGNKHRKIEQTAANNVSSRSHAIFQLSVFADGIKSTNSNKFVRSNNYKNDHFPADKLYKPSFNDTSNAQLWCKISFIDLAGSERASATQNRGIRLTEGAHINRSLLALANCINSLASASPNIDGTITSNHSDTKLHVKYRDSKLTHILKNSLEGEKCFVVMIANISPSSKAFEESHNTLKYANRAKNIKVKISNHPLSGMEKNEIPTCTCNLGISGYYYKNKIKSPHTDSSIQTDISGLIYNNYYSRKDSIYSLNNGLGLIDYLCQTMHQVIDSICQLSSENTVQIMDDHTDFDDASSTEEKENNSQHKINDSNNSDKNLNRTSFVSTRSNEENSKEYIKLNNFSLKENNTIRQMQLLIFDMMSDSLKKLNELKLEYNEMLNNEAQLLRKIQDIADDYSNKCQRNKLE
ncbi:hypothetical protein FG386_003235 [Cryptosporidium ryanae]|uniref:uncharacterized protein n=1 Tax=Cryptosporidium ryanae TaxID=515981 RepID=UPI00351A3736|nr:hypothetical protein FG386_003235 [Cryptosporidium ryanae]